MFDLILFFLLVSELFSCCLVFFIFKELTYFCYFFSFGFLFFCCLHFPLVNIFFFVCVFFHLLLFSFFLNCFLILFPRLHMFHTCGLYFFTVPQHTSTNTHTKHTPRPQRHHDHTTQHGDRNRERKRRRDKTRRQDKRRENFQFVLETDQIFVYFCCSF